MCFSIRRTRLLRSSDDLMPSTTFALTFILWGPGLRRTKFGSKERGLSTILWAIRNFSWHSIALCSADESQDDYGKPEETDVSASVQKSDIKNTVVFHAS